MQYSSRVIIFPRYFSTNVFIVVVEVFANKTLKNAHCKQNVLHACVPLSLPLSLSSSSPPLSSVVPLLFLSSLYFLWNYEKYVTLQAQQRGKRLKKKKREEKGNKRNEKWNFHTGYSFRLLLPRIRFIYIYALFRLYSFSFRPSMNFLARPQNSRCAGKVRKIHEK